MAFGVIQSDSGTVIVPQPADSPPVVAAAAPAPVVDSTDVISRYLNNIAAAAQPPSVGVAVTPILTTIGTSGSTSGGSTLTDPFATDAYTPYGVHVPEGFLGQNVTVTEAPSPAEIAATEQAGSVAVTPTAEDGAIDPPIETQEWGHDGQSDFDVLGFFPDVDGFELLAVETLKGKAFIDYVRAGCVKRGIDALVVLADSYNEGLGGGIGDNGTSYGPWQLHDHGALPRKYWNLGRNVARIQSWAWSTAGIDYALDVMQRVAQGAGSPDAQMRAIVFDFENPANTQAQYVRRLDTYRAFAAQGDKIWSMLAGYVNGAKFVAPSTPVTAPVKAKPTQTISAWRDFIAVLRDDVPAAGVHMQNTARRLRGAVT